MKPHVSGITLGVSDFERAKRFYNEGLGWPIHQEHGEWVSFSLGDGSAEFGLLPMAALAEDAGADAAGTGFRVERLGPGSFAVRGKGIERLLARHDIDNEDAMSYLEGRLRRIGVLKALEAEGFQPGDEIEIAGVTFELDPGAAT